jgi:hypothetical protein
LAVSIIAGNSPPAEMRECDDNICSTSEVPERGMPKMKIGVGRAPKGGAEAA